MTETAVSHSRQRPFQLTYGGAPRMKSPRQSVKCTGTRTNGEPCRAYAINGGTVCTAHGGRLPRVKAKAAANIAERRAMAEIAKLNLEPVSDPLNQLAILAAQMLAWRDSMAGKVNELTSLRYESHGEGGSSEQLRSEVVLWERALDRCERVLTAMARLNVDERLAKISERQADILESALRATLAERQFGLDIAAQDEAARSLGRRLRAIAPISPPGTG